MSNRSSSPDYLYYDMQVTNRQTSNAFNNNQLVFTDTRQSIILDKPEEYHMSVIRFQIDTPSLPTHRFEVQPNQNDADLGIYSVTLEYFQDANTSTPTNEEYLIWSPVNLDIAKPNAPNTTSNGLQVDSPYYYSYTFEHMIRLTNDTLQRAFDKLQILVGAALNSANPPVLHWNIDRQSAYITASKDYYDLSTYPHIKIYFNRSLHFLFNSMPFIEYSHNATLNRHYLITFSEEIDANPGIDLLSSQEYSTIANWSPVSSIVFTTGTLPVVSNLISDPVIYENNRAYPLSNGLDESINIISDFISDENCYRSNLLYVPSTLRFVDMYNSGPLRKVDIAVYWRDKFGFLKEFYLDPGCSCSIKILFQKKNINNSKIIF